MTEVVMCGLPQSKAHSFIKDHSLVWGEPLISKVSYLSAYFWEALMAYKGGKKGTKKTGRKGGKNK